MDNSCWIQTYTGLKFHPLNPAPEEICIEDIAHALSNICRFTGHCSEFYSVAQHSVYASKFVSKEYAMWGLLHDAAEAYINDLAKPLKDHRFLQPYKQIEDNIIEVIAYKFNLKTRWIPNEVKTIDKRLLKTEAADLNLLSGDWPTFGVDRLCMRIRPEEPGGAKRLFLDRFDACKNIAKMQTERTFPKL